MKRRHEKRKETQKEKNKRTNEKEKMLYKKKEVTIRIILLLQAQTNAPVFGKWAISPALKDCALLLYEVSRLERKMHVI